MLYWIILILIIGSLFVVKKNTKFYLFTAFGIFALGAIFRIVSLIQASEILMRLSFIIWVIGLFKAFKEINE